MKKEKVPVITEEQVAQGDAAATAQAAANIPYRGAGLIGREEAEEEAAVSSTAEAGPKPHKHFYRKDGTCACGKVRKPR